MDMPTTTTTSPTDTAAPVLSEPTTANSEMQAYHIGKLHAMLLKIEQDFSKNGITETFNKLKEAIKHLENEVVARFSEKDTLSSTSESSATASDSESTTPPVTPTDAGM